MVSRYLFKKEIGLMKNRVLLQRLAALAVLITAVVVAGCGPAANAEDTHGGSTGSSSDTLTGPKNLVNNLSGTEDLGTPEPGDTPDPGATEDAGGSQKSLITGTVDAIDGNTITIDGVQYTVNDPQLLAGLKVGDTVTLKLESSDSGALVVDDISVGQGGDDNESTQEATSDSTEADIETDTPELSDDSTDLETPEPTDNSADEDGQTSGTNTGTGGGQDDGGGSGSSHSGGGGGDD
jgi:hypothetical protein